MTPDLQRHATPQPTIAKVAESPLPHRRKISAADVRLLGYLPVLVAAAWLLPGSSLPRVARQISALPHPLALYAKGKRSDERAPSGTKVVGHAASLVERLLYHFRDGRPGGCNAALRLEGAEHLAAARDAGRGVVLWVADTAFAPLMVKKTLARHGYALHHLSQPEHGLSRTAFGVRVLNPPFNRTENRYLAERVVVQAGREHVAMRRLREVVANGGIVSITAGARAGKQTVWVPFLDAELPLATGAPALAHASGADLLPVFCVRESAHPLTFRTVIEAPLPVPADRARADAVRVAMETFVERHLPWCHEYADQWVGGGTLRRRA